MRDKKIMIRVSEREERMILDKAGDLPLATYARSILLGGVTRETQNIAKAPQVEFPYIGWTVLPNPENGKVEPVVVDDGTNYAICVQSPKGVQVLVRETDPLYEDVVNYFNIKQYE